MGNGLKIGKKSANLMDGCLDIRNFVHSESFDETYTVGEKIGGSHFSTVYLCYSTKDLNKKYAMKIMYGSSKDICTYNRVQNEIEIMQSFSEDTHPYILKLVDFNISELNHNSGWCVKLVFELCEGGDLFQYINLNGPYSEYNGRILIAKLTSVLAYIHQKDIIHRDIKPENVLLKTKEENGTQIKLSDFGLAKKIFSFSNNRNMNLLNRCVSLCGSDFYLPPEMILQTDYTEKVDLWSLGVLCYVILCGSPPFHNPNISNLYQQIIQADIQPLLSTGTQWQNLSPGARDFVQNLLKIEANDRPSAAECLKHRWLRGCLSSYELALLPPLDLVENCCFKNDKERYQVIEEEKESKNNSAFKKCSLNHKSINVNVNKHLMESNKNDLYSNNKKNNNNKTNAKPLKTAESVCTPHSTTCPSSFSSSLKSINTSPYACTPLCSTLDNIVQNKNLNYISENNKYYTKKKLDPCCRTLSTVSSSIDQSSSWCCRDLTHFRKANNNIENLYEFSKVNNSFIKASLIKQ